MVFSSTHVINYLSSLTTLYYMSISRMTTADFQGQGQRSMPIGDPRTLRDSRPHLLPPNSPYILYDNVKTWVVPNQESNSSTFNSLRPSDAIWRRQIQHGFWHQIWIPDVHGIISSTNMPMLWSVIVKVTGNANCSCQFSSCSLYY